MASFAALNMPLLVAVIVLGVLLLVGAILGIIWLMLNLLTLPWKGVKQAYPAPPATSPPSIRRTTVMIGPVRMKRCTDLTAEPGGLRIQVPFLGGALIPWEELKHTSPAKLFWRPAIQIGIGDPARTTLTLFQTDFDHLRQIRANWQRAEANRVDKQPVSA
jgi:hypothetical protein